MPSKKGSPKERQPQRLSGSVANPILTVRQIPLFGLRTRKRLQYFDSVLFTGSASIATSYIVSANGCYDPDITGTGHQPIGFDQMMVYYNHYTALGCRVRAVFQNTGTVSTHVGLSVTGSTTNISDSRQLVENGEMIYTVVTPSGVAGSMATLRTSANIASFQGVQQPLDDPNLRGDAASNPTEQTYFAFHVWNPVNATVPSVLIDFYLEYDVMFQEPRKASLSLLAQGSSTDPDKRASWTEVKSGEQLPNSCSLA